MNRCARIADGPKNKKNTGKLPKFRPLFLFAFAILLFYGLAILLFYGLAILIVSKCLAERYVTNTI